MSELSRCLTALAVVALLLFSILPERHAHQHQPRRTPPPVYDRSDQ